MRRRLLLICPEVPVPFLEGDPTRYFHFARELAREYDVHLAGPGDPGSVGALGRFCQAVHVVPPARPVRTAWRYTAGLVSRPPCAVAARRTATMCAALRSLFRDPGFDLVLLGAMTAQYLSLVPRGTPVVHDSMDLFYPSYYARIRHARRLHRRGFAWWEAVRFRWHEERLTRQVPLTIFAAEEDRCRLATVPDAGKTAVVPSGVDTCVLSPKDGIAPEKGLVVMTGSWHKTNTVAAAQWFCERVLPLVRRKVPGARLCLVGKHGELKLRHLVSPHVVVTGAVPDLRPFLSRAAAFVASYVEPEPFATGMKTKVVEAMSMGTPVVATPQAMRSIPAQHGRHAFIERTPEGFASSVMALLQDRALREHVGRQARALVVEHLDWQVVGRRLVSVLEPFV